MILFSLILVLKRICSPCNKIENEHDLKYGADFDPIPTETLMNELDKYFDTRIYRECVRYKDIDVQSTFCYAGSWSLAIDMSNGTVLKCHNCQTEECSFFENIENPYKWEGPVAMSCGIESCCLQYNFFSEGLIPDYPGKYSYGQLIYQPGLVSEYVRDKLDVRFNEIYNRLSKSEEYKVAIENKNKQILKSQNEMEFYKSILSKIHIL